MKVKKIAALAAIAMLTLASCKKDWTCDCEVTALGMTVPASTEIKDSNKSDAEDACDAFENTSSVGGASVSCELNEK